MADVLYIMNEDTGEVKTQKKLKDEDQVKVISFEAEQKQKKYLKSNDLCSQIEQELGGFCWVIYYNNSLFDNKVDIKNIARVIYLATFIEYDTNKLVIQEPGRQNKPFTERDLKVKLDLDRSVYSKFKKEMVDNDILIFKEDGIYMSPEFFLKGEINQHTKQIRQLEGNYSRIYVKTIRTLFEGLTDTRQHKTLGYLFKLLPYCDYELNIITRSPNTAQAYDEVLTKKDIAELLGVTEDTYKRIEKQLRKLVINVRDVTYYVIGQETIVVGDQLYMCYIINPFVFNSRKRNDFASLERIWIKLKK